MKPNPVGIVAKIDDLPKLRVAPRKSLKPKIHNDAAIPSYSGA